MLKNIISEMGNQAVLAENGMQAVKLAQRMKPQLIILDIAMPEMDGYEACEKLKCKLEKMSDTEYRSIDFTVYEEADHE